MNATSNRNNTALIVIDVQQGFNDSAYWGPIANHPQCEENVAKLLNLWQNIDSGPIVIVRHQSLEPDSPLAASSPGFALMSVVAAVKPDLLITK